MLSWLRKLRLTSMSQTGLNGGMPADVPIRSATQDLLSRVVIARRIASMLSASGVREGRVFAVRGSWGDGKSSLKNLVVEALDEQGGAPLHLEFNPWQWGDGDAIARALFEQMASKLGGAYAAGAASRARALRRYGGMLVGGSGVLAKAANDKGLVTWLPGAALIFSGLSIGLTSLPIKTLTAAALSLGGVVLVLGKLLNWLGEDRSATPLDIIRTDLEKRLERLERPLVVFVDDIDRLEPEQIRMLFRHIKVNANLPNIIFVLLFQTSIVDAALKPVGGAGGREYLEKIVQAYFDLPPVAGPKLMQIFGQELGALVDHLAIAENGFDQRRWGNVSIGGIQPFIRNLRDVRRLLTSIEIHLPLYHGLHVFEANIIDVIALETLRVFEPEFHAQLAANERLLLQSQRFSGDGREKSDRERVEALFELARPERREACRAMLKELFPSIEWALGGSLYSGDSFYRGWLNDKRVCTSRHFGRYFQLQLPEGAISESDFSILMEAAAVPEQLLSVIDDFRQRDALPSLVARFDESVDQLPLEQIEQLLPALLQLGDELSRTPGSGDPFNSPFVSAWRAASWYLRRVPEAAERARVFLNAMRATKALATPAMLISIELDAHEKTDSDYKPKFDLADLETLKGEWITTMIERSRDDALLDDDQLVSYLFRWKNFSGSVDAPKTWVAQFNDDPSKRVALLSRFLSVGSSHSWGDRVSVKTESYSKGSLTPFFDLGELGAWVSKLDRSDLSAEDARIMSILERHLDAWRRGESLGDR
jgi:predicted KAP-like P-loop ATPase